MSNESIQLELRTLAESLPALKAAEERAAIALNQVRTELESVTDDYLAGRASNEQISAALARLKEAEQRYHLMARPLEDNHRQAARLRAMLRECER